MNAAHAKKTLRRVLWVLLALVLVAGQLLVTWVIGRRMRRESLIDRIRNE